METEDRREVDIGQDVDESQPLSLFMSDTSKQLEDSEQAVSKRVTFEDMRAALVIKRQNMLKGLFNKLDGALCQVSSRAEQYPESPEALLEMQKSLEARVVCLEGERENMLEEFSKFQLLSDPYWYCLSLHVSPFQSTTGGRGSGLTWTSHLQRGAWNKPGSYCTKKDKVTHSQLPKSSRRKPRRLLPLREQLPNMELGCTGSSCLEKEKLRYPEDSLPKIPQSRLQVSTERADKNLMTG
ncbi:hypothetical protein KOW79_010017 [Hemibagrus wyckioides]|uniref:Uncharacterized protein n=1 Tax=Hemibagrus wyckioides TaxID=337641 RepID=A0A9D3SJB0_9TELE|nr:hypothetical protein KOW79_010017 [Hemibagrus wyckioides]